MKIKKFNQFLAESANLSTDEIDKLVGLGLLSPDWVGAWYEIEAYRAGSLGRNLAFRGFNDLTELPPIDFKIEGNLIIDGCTSLTRLPDGLQVGRAVHLEGCSSLTELPADLQIGTSLSLKRCTSLTRLPDDLRLENSLQLAECPNLTEFPKRLWVASQLWISLCPGLTRGRDGEAIRAEIAELGGYVGGKIQTYRTF